MVFSQILLVVLIILLIFSVGESVIKASKLSNIFVVVSLIAILISSFFSPINIFNSQFYLAGFFVPLIVSLYFCFKLQSVYSFLRIIVSALLVSILLLLYNSINLESISYNFLQPYILLGVAIGIASFFICKTFPASFIAVFLGTITTSIIYFAIQNLSTGSIGFIFGDEQSLCIILVSSVFSMFSLFLSRKMRYLKKKRARKIAIENQRSA